MRRYLYQLLTATDYTLDALLLYILIIGRDHLKSSVGYKAVDDYVQPGYTVAIGSGSTAYYAIERISQLLATGDLFGITVIPTSEFIKKQCIAKGIPVATLSTAPNIPIDVVIDGTDEIDAKLCLNKGGSGSILREKMTQSASKHVIIVADDSKLVRYLLNHFH
jgi:ribose 5-phosphate isomerase A